MAATDPDMGSSRSQWLQGLGVSQQLLALATPAGPAGSSVSALAAPPGKGPAPGATLISIAINRPDRFEPGGQQQLVVTGMFSDGKTQKVTGKVKWSSSDEDLLKVAGGGIAKVAQASGDVTITAELDQKDLTPKKVTDSVTVKIRFALRKIIVTPQDPLVAGGGTVEVLAATAVYDDKSKEDITEQVEWKSSDQKVADFMSRGYFVTGEAGTAILKATDEATKIFGSTKLTVPVEGKGPILKKVTISPLNPDIKTGEPVPFTAMGEFSDKSKHEVTNSVKWESSDPKVLGIDSKGLATPSLRSGNPLIRALDEKTNESGSTTAYVEMPGVKHLTLTPKTVSVISGDAVPVKAMAILAGGARMKINHAVEWTMSNQNAAMMILNNEQVKGLEPEEVSIEAYEPFSEEKDTMTLKVLPPVLRSILVDSLSPTMTINEAMQFTAAGTMSDGKPAKPLKKLHWTTSKENVVEITTAGWAKAKAKGKSEITATDLATGVFGSREVEVK
jgi:hypothetical protein